MLLVILLTASFPAVAQDVPKPPIPDATSPDEFRDLVLKAQGRVDFIFEDARPFAQCHASTLVETADGSLLAAWFGGTKEKNPDVAIWLSRRAPNADQWSEPVRVAKTSETAHWNPVLFRDAADKIHLFFKVGIDVPSWATWWMTSADNGATWSAPAELVPGDIGGRGPVKNKAIILHDGSWLAPASTEVGGKWEPFADRSVDDGKTWERTRSFEVDAGVLPGKGAIQPTFWESAPFNVHALMRTTGGWIARADSLDGGRSWSQAYPTNLPNNNSGIDATRLDDGRVLLVYNPIGVNWGDRTPLTLAVSADNALTFRNIAHLETGEGEYSYPAIVKTSKGVAISYTWRRERVRCWLIPVEAFQH